MVNVWKTPESKRGKKRRPAAMISIIFRELLGNVSPSPREIPCRLAHSLDRGLTEAAGVELKLRCLDGGEKPAPEGHAQKFEIDTLRPRLLTLHNHFNGCTPKPPFPLSCTILTPTLDNTMPKPYTPCALEHGNLRS